MTRGKKFYIILSIILFSIGFAIIGLGIWSFLYLSEIRSSIAEQKYRASKYTEKTEGLKELKDNYEEVKEMISLISLTLPDQKESSKLLTDIDQLARDSSLKITLIQSNAQVKKDSSGSDQSLLQTTKGKYSYELPLKLELEGSFTGVLEFIKKIERYQRLLNITSMEITKDSTESGDFVKMKIQLTAYLMK